MYPDSMKVSKWAGRWKMFTFLRQNDSSNLEGGCSKMVERLLLVLA
jgi:hypothetical protein